MTFIQLAIRAYIFDAMATSRIATAANTPQLNIKPYSDSTFAKAQGVNFISERIEMLTMTCRTARCDRQWPDD
jgi:hypothetical protein